MSRSPNNKPETSRVTVRIEKSALETLEAMMEDEAVKENNRSDLIRNGVDMRIKEYKEIQSDKPNTEL